MSGQVKTNKPKLTAAQRKKIWAVAGEIGLIETTLRDVVEAVSGQRHISQVSRDEARRLIDLLERMIGRIPNKGYSAKADRDAHKRVGPGGKIIYLSTPAQRDKIGHLASQLDWGSQRLDNFIRKMYDKPDVRHLLRHEARGIIEALTSMATRKEDGEKAKETKNPA